MGFGADWQALTAKQANCRPYLRSEKRATTPQRRPVWRHVQQKVPRVLHLLRRGCRCTGSSRSRRQRLRTAGRARCRRHIRRQLRGVGSPLREVSFSRVEPIAIGVALVVAWFAGRLATARQYRDRRYILGAELRASQRLALEAVAGMQLALGEVAVQWPEDDSAAGHTGASEHGRAALDRFQAARVKAEAATNEQHARQPPTAEDRERPELHPALVLDRALEFGERATGALSAYRNGGSFAGHEDELSEVIEGLGQVRRDLTGAARFGMQLPPARNRLQVNTYQLKGLIGRGQ